jgi:hypothetical protein
MFSAILHIYPDLTGKGCKKRCDKNADCFFYHTDFLGFIGIAYYSLYSALNYKTADFERKAQMFDYAFIIVFAVLLVVTCPDCFLLGIYVHFILLPPATP